MSSTCKSVEKKLRTHTTKAEEPDIYNPKGMCVTVGFLLSGAGNIIRPHAHTSTNIFS